jgi:hypothetical protein
VIEREFPSIVPVFIYPNGDGRCHEHAGSEGIDFRRGLLYDYSLVSKLDFNAVFLEKTCEDAKTG